MGEMDRWRFIDDCPATGAENMARDEYLLDRIEREGGAPILRLYSFHPSAITIGAHQDVSRALDLEAVRADSLDVARRVTGGRALLHEDELTYCVVGPRGALGDGLMGTYLRISEALAAALRSIGVADARVERRTRAPRPGAGTAPCLASTTRHELAVRGRKIAGSAERLTRNGFLQHGSILLTNASARITRYTRGAGGTTSEDLIGVTSVSEELGTAPSDGELRSAIRGAFAEAFGVAWSAFALSPAEAREVRARALLKEREFLEILARRCLPSGAVARALPCPVGETPSGLPAARREVAT
jgi:lipoyl(octanoyl) transferase